MNMWQCNSCGSTYTDRTAAGSVYFHVCSPEEIEHAQCGATGEVVKAEKRTPRSSIRNENPLPGVFFRDGECLREIPDPETPGRTLTVPAVFGIVSEGKGRTRIE
jgi:hypothetical protein